MYKTKSKLGKELCNYCPLSSDEREFSQFSEGCCTSCHCHYHDMAYDNYLDTNGINEKIVSFRNKIITKIERG